MTASRLHLAAERLEGLAAGATPGPWSTSRSKHVSGSYVHRDEPNGRMVRHATDTGHDDAAYIAALNPTVGAALAELLRAVIGNRTSPYALALTEEAALAVADAVLGERVKP